MSAAIAEVIRLPLPDPESEPRRFGRRGTVSRFGPGTYRVMMGETLIGEFEQGDPATRDLLIAIVVKSQGRTVPWAEVAHAFRVGRATVGRAMQRLRAGGMPAVANMGHRGGRSKRTPRLRRRLFELFGEGYGVREAHRVVAGRVSYGTVQSLHVEWRQQDATSGAPGRKRQRADVLDQAPLAEASELDDDGIATQVKLLPEVDVNATTSEDETPPLVAPPEPTRQAMQRRERRPEELVAKGHPTTVQHVGSWILLAMLAQRGLYQEATTWASHVSEVTLRVVLDAFAIALAIGEGCVEGVRRLATPSAPVLLRHPIVVSPGWVREVLGRIAGEAGAMFRVRVTERLLQRAAEDRDVVWLYVDNHHRRYTGQHTIRKGWRMQDKRAVPGTPDYYVHDEDGNPLWRATSSEHESLSAWLPRVLKFARWALGDDVDIVLSFDRGGAHPGTMACLRDLEGGFVTYEIKPYASIPVSHFTQQLQIVLPSRPCQPVLVRFTEARDRNLRRGRGRVRRIALLTEDERQINILTCSTLPAEVLIRGHLARWGRQENQFKHGVARWGFNQLDGRRTTPYPADAIVPNPDRRRIERQLQLVRAAEGRARCELAELDGDDPSRPQQLEDIASLVALRQDLEALRPTMPLRAPVSATSLAGKLVRHTTEYKDVLDTLRILFANVEADLAATVAPSLRRPREAKKVVANLFSAPGAVSLGRTRWRVRLMPAAREDERAAIAKLLRTINRRHLVLPGDPTRRPLHFSLARGSDG